MKVHNRSRMKLKQINYLFGIVALILISGYFMIPYTESRYSSQAKNTDGIKFATWNFKINGNSTNKLAINLADTVVENSYTSTSVIPGSEGVIPLTVDSTNTKVALNYELKLDSTNTNLPTNLKLYNDKNHTTLFTGISRTISLGQTGIDNYQIYWKWDYTTEDETSNWSSKDLVIYFVATASQKVDDSI